MATIHNYSAGPCILPPSVLEQASQAVREWDNNRLSLVEMSHRSKPFVAVMEECRALTKELLQLPDRYEVLYLQGGASLGFLTAAMNFLPEGGKAAYADTGTWSAKAIKEAKHAGQVHVVTSSKESNWYPAVGGWTETMPSFTSPPTTPFLARSTPTCQTTTCRLWPT